MSRNLQHFLSVKEYNFQLKETKSINHLMPESLPLNELHKTDRLITKKNQKIIEYKFKGDMH